jgi:hypothetical protein
MGLYRVNHPDGHSSVLTINGRDEWALQQLMNAGAKGCTPKDNPAPRWSGYVFNLRQMGLDIETVHERHGGEFPGMHARYVLHSFIEVVEGSDAKAA